MASNGGSRVLVIALAPVGERMQGNAIRSVELGRTLAASGARVTLAGRAPSRLAVAEMPVLEYDLVRPTALRAAIVQADVIVSQPPPPTLAAWIRASPARVVHDLYDPEALEVLEFFRDAPLWRRRLVLALCLDRTLAAVRGAHHLMCAGETQRDLWIGTMLGAGLLVPALYDRDPSLRDVIDTVGFGVPTDAPRRSAAPGPREILGLDAEAEILLWNGGIWGWLDPHTAIEAVARLRRRRPQAVLVFMGAGGQGEAARAAAEARARAGALGLLNDGVYFHGDWVPYERRADWLLDASCAISAHVDHVETRFAYRTRLLDCLWAGLPVACTSGDELSSLVEHEDLGVTARPGDADALATAVEQVLDSGRDAFAAALARAGARRTWPRVSAPLLTWAKRGSTDAPSIAGHARLPPGAALRTAALRAVHATAGASGVRVWPGI